VHDYDLENQMWDRQGDALRDADNRRLVTIAHSGPNGQGDAAPGLGFPAAIIAGLRSLLVPGRTARIEGDAS
jgi:hypothetical protein